MSFGLCRRMQLHLLRQQDSALVSRVEEMMRTQGVAPAENDSDARGGGGGEGGGRGGGGGEGESGNGGISSSSSSGGGGGGGDDDGGGGGGSGGSGERGERRASLQPAAAANASRPRQNVARSVSRPAESTAAAPQERSDRSTRSQRPPSNTHRTWLLVLERLLIQPVQIILYSNINISFHFHCFIFEIKFYFVYEYINAILIDQCNDNYLCIVL